MTRPIEEIDLDIETLKHDWVDVTLKFAKEFSKLNEERLLATGEVIRSVEETERDDVCRCRAMEGRIDSRICPIHKKKRKWEKPPHVYSKKGRGANQT